MLANLILTASFFIKLKKKRKHNDTNEQEEENSSKHTGKRKHKASEENKAGETGEVPDLKRPRIRINVKSGTKDETVSVKGEEAPMETSKLNRISKKRKTPVEDTSEKSGDIDLDVTDESKKPKKKIKIDVGAVSGKVKSKKSASGPPLDKKPTNPESSKKKIVGGKKGSADYSIFADLSYWKKSRESLGKGFVNARKNFTQHGPWGIPEPLPENSFADIAERTLDRMTKHDKYSVFAEAVTDKQAPGYSDIIKKPMDFGTMRKKVAQKKYGTGSKAAASFYEDFLLVFDNCQLYNSEESEVTEEAARMFGLLPEAYVSACNQAIKNISK